jgi:uncharacterized protein with HEPN domain
MNQKELRAADYLGHMLDAISQIHEYTAGMAESEFYSARLIQDAVVRNIEILGEAAQNIRKHCPELAEVHAEIPWQDIYGMRNRLAHGYFEVNYKAVWQVVVRELPILEPTLRVIATNLSPGTA